MKKDYVVENSDLQFNFGKIDKHKLLNFPPIERDGSISAPPVDKLIISDEIELGDIQTNLFYSDYYRRNIKNEVRLQPPRYVIRGQNSIWMNENNDAVARAFSSTLFEEAKKTPSNDTKRSLIDQIDEDHTAEKSVEYKGTSRTTTPIGDITFFDADAFNSILNIKTNIVSDPVSMKKSQKLSLSLSDIGRNIQETNNVFLKEIFDLYTQFYSDDRLNSGDTSVSIKDLCCTVSKDQEGSRLIQKRLETCSSEEVSWFFKQILENTPELSNNLFGNYVIQKIIPCLSERELLDLTEYFLGQIYALSTHPYGCRVIQKIVDHSPNISCILDEMKGSMLSLIEDQNGNHVIQKCIERCNDRSLVLEQFDKNPIFLSTHRYGCRVIQRLLEFCSKKEVKRILNLLIENIECLVNDQYGNYVIQHLLTIGDQEKKDAVIEKITHNCYELSKHKFSSNVIEQCIKISNMRQKEEFMKKFLEMDEDKPRLFYMCIDMYGNYVVQKFYDVSNEAIRQEIKRALRPYIKDLKKASFARHILYKITT